MRVAPLSVIRPACRCALVLGLAVLQSVSFSAPGIPPIPAAPREYRAAWCATVTNIDWPPKAGVSSTIVTQQKNRLIAHLDAMEEARMNAMYLQVRPACDAMYNSTIEPPSQWLTGSQTTAATWDPLAFAVTEAHKRGIELHAWVNPYRAALDQKTSNKSIKHVMRKSPELCVSYSDGKTYMDPGKQGSINWIVNVVSEIVTKYNVDGVVFDDYFYPGTDFDDAATYQAYRNSGGKMALDDWRRDNVNRLIQACYNKIHSIRSSCQFEVGPFGIWQPGYPKGVSGANYYATHYCDTRLWLKNGWVDSLSPQLYWPMDSPGQPFGALIDWWVAQNPNRHVMASMADYRVGGADSFGNTWSDKTNQEIINQINRVKTAGGVGTVHYSMKFITDNFKGKNDTIGLKTALMNGPYKEDALRPASTWLDNTPPPPPNISVSTPSGPNGAHTFTFSQNPTDEKASWWCVYTYNGSRWNLKVVPGMLASYTAPAPVMAFAVSAVDRNGNESARAGFADVDDWTIYE